MPLYQYICQACGHEFEVMTSMDKRDETVCPKCGGAVKRSWMGACAFGSMKYADSGKTGGCCAGCPHCGGH